MGKGLEMAGKGKNLRVFFPREGKEGETWQVGFVDARIGHFQMETFSGGGVYKLSSHYDKDTKSGPGGRGTLPPIELFFFQLCLRNI